MKHMMLAHAFRFVDRVIFRVGEHNWRSRRAVEKLGGILTDRRQTECAENGSEYTTVFYALARDATLP